MFKMNDCMLWYNRVASGVFINILFADNTIKRKYQFTCAQVFVTEFGYNHIVLMKSKGDVHRVMGSLFNNVGFPPDIISNNAG